MNKINVLLEDRKPPESKDPKLKTIYKNLRRKLLKTIEKFSLIDTSGNDTILLGVSGGKDSLLLSKLLNDINGKSNYKFKFKVVHIYPDFGEERDKIKENIEFFMNLWGIKYEVIKASILGSLKSGFSMNCYWCSMQRRIRLMEYAQKNDFTKIALGHHLDDITTTLLMNIIYNGNMASMSIKMKYKKFNFEIIRPMGLIREEEIKKFWKYYPYKYYQPKGKCPYLNKNSAREKIKNFINEMDKIIPHAKENIIAAENNINLEYLNILEDGIKKIKDFTY